jgi:hypothetical protein
MALFTTLNIIKRPLMVVSALGLMFQPTAFGLILDWGGQYRFEYVEIDKTEMTSGSRKGYLLNNLVLMPHIIPSDGFEVVSKIHLSENNDSRYTNSQAGMTWGNSHNAGPGFATHIDNSNALAQNRPKTGIGVSQLYLKVDQEWGSLVVGRAPVQFGLGITHNAGNDAFSHWYDTRDILAYKMHIGNLFIMPSISKQFAGDFALGNEITNQTLHFEYKNNDTGDWLGLFYETSKGNINTNDVPKTPIGGASYYGAYNVNAYNIILGKDFSDFNFRVEGGFQSGSTGITHTNGKKINLNGYAVVTEFNVIAGESKNSWHVKAGSVSGDNPDTEDFEGYLLDRNYDVALLLFNHSMGQNADIFKTSIGHDPAFTSNRNSLDDEYISNVLFVAPRWTRQLADRWNMRNTLAVARLNNTRMKVGAGVEDIDSNVGVEWDLGFSYKANDNMEWRFDSGLLMPGKAFQMGTADLKTSTVIGLSTSAAITF